METSEPTRETTYSHVSGWQREEKPIMLNVAADAVVDYAPWDRDLPSMTREEIVRGLQRYVDRYRDTGVGCLLFNVNYQRVCFESDVWDAYWEVDDVDELSDWPKKHAHLHEAGVDPFRVCIDRCRSVGISPWISLRMNDHHYLDNPDRISSLMRDHPEYRISRGMFDYASSEVRNYYRGLIDEVLERYDVDGIELDWLRSPELFESGAETRGKTIINRFMEDVKREVDERADETGRDIAVCARVPSLPEDGREAGLDGATWIQNGWVDVLVPMNFWVPIDFDIPFERWHEEIDDSEASYVLAAGADYGICTDDDYTTVMRNDIETMRGFAVASYHRGADAVYLFNHFDDHYAPDGDHRAVLTDGRDTGSDIPRRHVLTSRGRGLGNQESVLPAELTGDSSRRFDMYTGPRSNDGDYVVRVGLDSSDTDPRPRVTVNDRECRRLPDLVPPEEYTYRAEGRWNIVDDVSKVAPRILRFSAPLDATRDGYNAIEITSGDGGSLRVLWLEVYIGNAVDPSASAA